jgi:oligopeptide transport system substrate-binding protein
VWRRGRGTLALVALLVAALVAGCTAEPAATPPDASPSPSPTATDAPSPDATDGGTLRIGLGVDPVSIDPRFLADEEGELVVDALFDPLVRLDDRFQVVPAAAEAWEESEDGRELTFDLRRDATFHDGTPVTAEDFVRTFTRIADGTAEPASFLAYLLEPIEGATEAAEGGGTLAGIEAVDETTLRIRLTEPLPGFLRTLAHPSLVPVPASADRDLAAFGEQPIGNGPFAMAGPREPEAFIRLTRVEDHPRAPRLDEVVLQLYPDDPLRERQWEDLVDGQLQVAELPAELVEEARERFGSSPDGYRGPGVLDGITSTVYLYGFDTTQPPFDDARVRRAISRAIDREALAEDVLQGTRVPATSLVPPSIPGSQAGACEHCRHDPAAARDELASVTTPPDEDATEEADAGEEPEAAGPVLEELRLTHNRGRTHTAIAESVATDLEEALGISVELEGHDLQPFVLGVRRGEYPLFRLGWESDDPDPLAYLYPLFHSSQVGLDNLTRFADDEVDALLERARTATDPDEAREAAAEAERRILDAAPVIPLLWYRHTRVVAPEVRGLRWSPLGRVDLARVWLQPE